MSAGRWVPLKVLMESPGKLSQCSCWESKDDTEIKPYDHNRLVGGIILNLQALELTLRFFLLRKDNGYMNWPKQTDTVLDENFITNYLSLGQIVDYYNKNLSVEEQSNFSIDRTVVTVRDTIAHGRLVTEKESFPAIIWKFEKPVDGKVPASSTVLTKEWLVKTSNNVEVQRDKAAKCFRARGYRGLG
jgi:hypothetical protein